MVDYSASSVPWYSYRSYVKTVTIEDGVTSIGKCAFDDCTRLTSVTIGSSVTSIGSYAFYDCSSLTSITIPDGVTSIGDYAFYYCSSLTSVTFCDNSALTSIGSHAFYNCSSLTSITIPDTVTSIGSDAFGYCSSLTSITIPDGVTSISSYAFRNCTSLTSVSIPDAVTSIGAYAFYGCTSLTSVTIPDGVTSIGNYAFYNCSSLTSVTIGSGVTSIGSYAFSDCTSLTSITSLNTTPPTIYSSTFSDQSSSVTLYAASTDYVTATYWEDFLTIKYTDDISSTTTITGQCGDNLTYTLSLSDGALIIKGTGDMYGYSSSFLAPWYVYRSCITSITISDEATSIGNYAFGKCTCLMSITIPDGVTSIGSSAFYYCTSLTSVTFGDNSALTSIGDYAFKNCSSLTKIIIPENVTSIGSYAFTDCSELTTIYSLNETPPTIKNTTFSDQYEYAKLYASERYQTSDWWEKFYTIYINSGTCGDDLTWLYCDGTLTISGTGAMSNFYEDAAPWFENFSGSIKTVIIGENVTTLGTYALYNLINLTAIYSYNETPPTARSTSFDSDEYIYVTLYAASTDYTTADYWKNFSNTTTIGDDTLEEDDYSADDSDDDASDDNNAINSISASTSAIRAIGNTIVITTEAAQTALVYNLSGQLIIKRAVTVGETSIGMPTGGVYVVTLADGTKAKVLVK